MEREVFIHMKRIWHWLTSMRTALFLLLVIAGVAVFGSLIPQGESKHYYYHVYGGWRANLIILLQLHDVFRAWVFLGPAFLLTASLLACSIKRFIPAWRQAVSYQYHDDQGFYEDAPVKKQVLVDHSPGQAAASFHSSLKRRRYRVFINNKEDKYYLFARRGQLGPFGSIFTHLGVVIIIAGAIYGALTGFAVYVNIPQGDSYRVEQGGFSVQLQDFSIDYYDGYMPKQYYSQLRVTENGRLAAEETISVNNPLNYRGVKIYQFDYGWVLDGTLHGFGLDKKVTLFDRELTPLLGDINIKAFFYPDFVLNSAGHPGTKSPIPNNPKVVYAIYKGASVLGYDIAGFNETVNIPVSSNEHVAITFNGYRQYSGLQIARDPGAPLVFAGAGLVLVGLLVGFYVYPRRVWAKIIPEPGGTRVFAAGTTSRFPERLAGEISALLDELAGGRNEPPLGPNGSGTGLARSNDKVVLKEKAYE